MIQKIIMLNVKGLSCLSVCVLARRANFARIKSNKFSWLLELRFPFSRHFSTQSRTLQRQWTSSMNSTPSTTQGLMRTRKDVVTAFIRKSNATVLLVRRSDQVGSYKNYWGGVSGGVEGSESLLRRAQIEIQEEVGYSADNIKLVRTGRPLLVDDGRLHFRVHPFLFDFVDQAAESAKPQLNWENVESRFIDPDVISQLQTVPKLICTLERVIMSEEQEAAVGRIIEDRDSGAAELALLAVSSLEEEANRLLERPRKVMDGEMALENFRNFAYHLGNCRPAMAPLANAVALVLSKMNDNLANRFGEAFRSVADSSIISKSLLCAASSVKEVLVKSKTSVVQNAISLIGNRTTIMTISKSSTLLETFLEALKRHMDYNLIVCESRPLCEGVTVATRCAEAGLRNITLITDAQMAHFMHYADVIMVGGDAVTDSGVYNKVGTYLMALAANHTGKPVYIILDSLKLSPGSLYSVLHDDQDDTCNPSEENDGDELRQAWVGMPFSPAIQVRNFYFEKTPLDLITKMVNEHGVLDPVDIPNQNREMKNMYLAVFDPSL